MYISVIPSRHSLSTSPLTYGGGDVFSQREQIIPGSLVEIEVGKFHEIGVIVGESTISLGEKDIKIKDIGSIITNRTVIEPYMLEIMKELSRDLLLPIHRVFSLFFPSPLQKRLIKYDFPLLATPHDSNKRESMRILHHLSENPHFHRTLLSYVIPGTIVVCPDDFFLTHLENSWNLPSTHFLMQDSTDTKKAQSWIDIQGRKYDQIVGTRKILYYNLAKYQRIIYLEDAFFREYTYGNSRIPHLDVLDGISRHTNMDIIILSSIPLLTTLQKFRHFTLLNRP